MGFLSLLKELILNLGPPTNACNCTAYRKRGRGVLPRTHHYLGFTFMSIIKRYYGFKDPMRHYGVTCSVLWVTAKHGEVYLVT